MTADLYHVLGLTPDATQLEMRQRHRSLVRQLHPDAGGSPADARRLDQVNRAWDVLSDPATRRRYDEQRAAGIADAGSSSASRPGGQGATFGDGSEMREIDDVWGPDDTPLSPAMDRMLRIGPMALLLGLLVTLFVVSAYARDEPTPTDPGPIPAGNRCAVIVGPSVVDLVACETPGAYRVVGVPITPGGCPAGTIQAQDRTAAARQVCVEQPD